MRGFDGIYVIALVSSTQYQSTRVRASNAGNGEQNLKGQFWKWKKKQNGILAWKPILAIVILSIF